MAVHVAVRMSSDGISCAFSIGKTNLNVVSFWKIFSKFRRFYCLAHPYYPNINFVGFRTLLNTFVFESFFIKRN